MHFETGGPPVKYRPPVSPLPVKRAAAYRVMRERCHGLVPRGQQKLTATHGDQTGHDKSAGFSILHLHALAEIRCIDQSMTYRRPGWRLPIYSRKVVGWQVYETESSELASEVMRDICLRENIAPNQVVLHSDNGSSMKGATMLQRCKRSA